MLDELKKAHLASYEGRKSTYACTDAVDDITLADPHAELDEPKMARVITLDELDV